MVIVGGGWAKTNERGGVRILVLVGGGGGVFTPEYSYGTISQVICENREKRRDLNLVTRSSLIDLSAVGFSRPNRIQDTGYTYNTACGACCIHGSILPCIITTRLPLGLCNILLSLTCVCVCLCVTPRNPVPRLSPLRAKVRAVTSVGGE